MHSHDMIAEALETLAGSNEYRVLRLLGSIDQIPIVDAPHGSLHTAAIVDVEATGLDPQKAKIIELAVSRIVFDDLGQIIQVDQPQIWREDPGEALDPIITQITGLTNADLVGHRIDDEAAIALIGEAEVIIAHNASYDAPIIERRLPAVAGKAWACSCNDIDWRALKLEGRALSHLLMQLGWFYEAHRAEIDIIALTQLLSSTVRNKNLLQLLMERASAVTYRIYTLNSPFSAKDALKARGYHWDPERKSWWVDVAPAAKDDELDWLSAAIYHGTPNIKIKTIDWKIRHR